MAKESQHMERSKTVECLTAKTVYRLAEFIEYLKSADEGDLIVHSNGSIEKKGKGYILFVLIELTEMLKRHGLASTNWPALEELIQDFKNAYNKRNS
ncbi:MAG: hypothetical protein ABUK03_02810, partial [Dehalococcoidales bacterium]